MDIERKRAFIIRAIYFLIIAAIFVVVVKYTLGLLGPFVIAFIIVCILRKPTRFLVKRFKLPHKPVAMLAVLVFYCTVGLVITWLGFRAAAGIRALIHIVPQIYENHIMPTINEGFLLLEELVLRMDGSLINIFQRFESQLLDWLGTAISGLSGWAVSAASAVAMAIPGLFIQLVLMVISTFFLAADYNTIRDFCLKQLNERGRELFLQIKTYVVGTLFVCIGSYILIMSLTFVELSIFLSLIGIEHAILIAALISLFDILPVLGTGGIMIPWGLINLVGGNFALGVELLLVYVAVTVIRNIVEPKIVGSQLGLHPVVTLASMFAGVQLAGVVGLFGFPICLSLLRYLNDKGSIHLFKMPEQTKE